MTRSNKDYYEEGRAGVELGLFYPLGDHISETLGASVYEPTVPSDNAVLALVQAVTENIRYTLDGTDPEAAVGFVITAGRDPILLPLSSNTTLKFIRETDGSILQLQFGE